MDTYTPIPGDDWTVTGCDACGYDCNTWYRVETAFGDGYDVAICHRCIDKCDTSKAA
jgi:hypothetical protein